MAPNTTAETREAPGTALLYDTTHGENRVVLVPQPSLTDPNDPLRWSIWKKWIALLNACFYAFTGSITGPIMAAGMIPLTKTLNEPLQRISYANGATLICQGVATALWMPFAVKYGRRPVYLLSNLLMGIACFWCGIGAETSYTSLISGRAFLGIFEAPIESIVPSTITDIFFLHERGEKVAFYGLSVLGGNTLGPMISAFIVQYINMKWAFFIIGIAVLVAEIPMFFFFPETKFTGARVEIHSLDDPAIQEVGRKGPAVLATEKDGAQTPDSKTDNTAVQIKKQTFVETLRFWGTNDPTISLKTAFLRPFILTSYPTVVWSCIIYGTSLTWNLICGGLTAQIFGAPPYNFNPQNQGLVFLASFIGSLVGTYLCGPLADRIANFFTKRNGGVREPEMRLPTCIPAALITIIGAITCALALKHETHWAGPVVGLGIVAVGAQMGATLSMSYSLDCHKELSVELMVTIAAIKSTIAWIWSWIINDFYEAKGPITVFMAVLAVNLFAYLLTIPLYLKGKSIRLWIQDKNFLRLAD